MKKLTLAPEAGDVVMTVGARVGFPRLSSDCHD